MRRIVFFPPEEMEPRFMWAPVDFEGNSGYMLDITLLKTLTSINYTYPYVLRPFRVPPKNAWTKDALPHEIAMLYDDNFNLNNANMNLAAVDACGGMCTFLWRGPLFACSHTKFQDFQDDFHEHDYIAAIHDFSMCDSSDLVANLIALRNFSGQQMQRTRRGKIDCVKILSGGEEASAITPSLRAVRVPPSHPIFEEDVEILDVSDLSLSNPSSLVHQ